MRRQRGGPRRSGCHTVYAPKKFTSESPIIQWLWNTLRSFSSDERGKFLQFCLARSRLPPTTSREGSWRMKVNVLEAANQRDLPTAETWSAQAAHTPANQMPYTHCIRETTRLTTCSAPPSTALRCAQLFQPQPATVRSERLLREKLHLAIMHCSSING